MSDIRYVEIKVTDKDTETGTKTTAETVVRIEEAVGYEMVNQAVLVRRLREAAQDSRIGKKIGASQEGRLAGLTFYDVVEKDVTISNLDGSNPQTIVAKVRVPQ